MGERTNHPDLGHLEAEVMDLLWSSGTPVTAREVVDALGARGRPLAHTTVLTVLDHLRTKALVERRREGRSFHWSPTLGRDEHVARLLRQVLDDHVGGGAAMLHFVGDLRPHEVADLRAALDQLDPPADRPSDRP